MLVVAALRLGVMVEVAVLRQGQLAVAVLRLGLLEVAVLWLGVLEVALLRLGVLEVVVLRLGVLGMAKELRLGVQGAGSARVLKVALSKLGISSNECGIVILLCFL